ncbi:hypothetical protein K450DRAFT_269122 [Umbelopsis ramanniana AG]|uniref:Uncharacterized protein n=1 Tax=Umbelopsis ramanniana AG TaxID=1314678 RepID=A0AAD5EG37_UMBRA|nr:uncharacterized protein K450DRAFT_269122 [Umbelopsis ramanniana AG]KAI8582772.1 hypothetical protein K450DRAFT_269122 [Umbelopsis ramanniana AG]
MPEYNVVDRQLPDLVDLVLKEKWKIPSYAVNSIMNINKNIEFAKSFDLFEAVISESTHEGANFEEETTLMPFHTVSALSESRSLPAHSIQHNVSPVSPATAPKIMVEDMIMNEKFQCPKATVDTMLKIHAELFKPVHMGLSNIENMARIQ